MDKNKYVKDNGVVYQLLPVFISILVVLCIVIVSGDSMLMIRRRDEINQVARTYLLKMEGRGYLTYEDQIELTEKLIDLKVSSIDMSGTTMESVSYGDYIHLHIEGVFEHEAVRFIPLKEKEVDVLTMPVVVDMMSTAKH